MAYNEPYKNGQVFVNNQFSTADKKARFIPITPKLPVQQTSSDYPFVMNSGRIRDQWHTMSRTGKSTALSTHITRPYIEINPIDASRLNIKANDLITANAKTGQVTAHAKALSTRLSSNLSLVPLSSMPRVNLLPRDSSIHTGLIFVQSSLRVRNNELNHFPP